MIKKQKKKIIQGKQHVLIVKKVKKLDDDTYESTWNLTEDQMGFLLTFAINSLVSEGLVTIQEEVPEQLDLLDQLTDDLTKQ